MTSDRGSAPVVRPYRAEDRPAVRQICHATGYMGSPASWYWRDLESFADVFSGWYTDHEPGSSSVVELDGRVVGYLLGCLDSRQGPHIDAVIAGHLVAGRHVLVRPGTAGFFWRSAADLVGAAARHDLPPTALHDDRWPAHLHINLLPIARGCGAGGALIRTWLDRLEAEGVRGCHLETVQENHRAIAFFEAMGFRRHGKHHAIPGMRSPHGARHHTQLMVQDLPRPAHASGG